jgi:hypothetical protein
MQCQYIYEDGHQCGMQAQVLGDSRGFCINHDPTRSEEEVREWKRKGGRTSRKVKLIDVEEIQPVEDVTDLKQLLNSVLFWLVEGRIDPSQARALVNVGNSLRDVLALELFELIERLNQVEAEVSTIKGGKQWLLLDEPLQSNSEENSDL